MDFNIPKFFGFMKNVSPKVVINANDVIIFLNTNAAVSSVSSYLSSKYPMLERIKNVNHVVNDCVSLFSYLHVCKY